MQKLLYKAPENDRVSHWFELEFVYVISVIGCIEEEMRNTNMV